MEITGERFISDDLWGTKSESEHRHRYRAIKEFMAGKIVLDAACGSGYGSCILAEYAESVEGIDVSAEAINFCREMYSKSNLNFSTMSVTDIQFPSNSFDVVVSFETLEHISEKDQKIFLKEIRRVLRPDGVLIMSSPNRAVLSDIVNWNWDNEYHVCELSENEFKNLLDQHFEEVSLYGQNIVGTSWIFSDELNQVEKMISSSHFTSPFPSEYIIAVCSDSPVDERFFPSVYIPNIQQYYRETYLPFTFSCLYLDEGLGFVESSKLTSFVDFTGRGNFEVSFSFPRKNISKVRFDLCEKPCKISSLDISSNIKCEVSGGNYFDFQDDIYCFLTLDPFLFFDLEKSEQENVKITISGHIGIPTYKDYLKIEENQKKMLEQQNLLETENEMQNENISVLKKENEMQNQNISVLKKENEMQNENISALKKENEIQNENMSALKKENEIQKDQVLTMETENQIAQAKINEFSRQLAQLRVSAFEMERAIFHEKSQLILQENSFQNEIYQIKEKCENLSIALEQNSHHNEQLCVSLEHSNNHNQQLIAALEHSNSQNEQLSYQLSGILSTKSYRIMNPLRKMRRVIGRIFK